MKDYSKVFDMVADATEADPSDTEKVDSLLVGATAFDNTFQRLVLALRGLYDEQNGAPLERDREAWEAAYSEAGRVLGMVEKEADFEEG